MARKNALIALLILTASLASADETISKSGNLKLVIERTFVLIDTPLKMETWFNSTQDIENVRITWEIYSENKTSHNNSFIQRMESDNLTLRNGEITSDIQYYSPKTPGTKIIEVKVLSPGGELDSTSQVIGVVGKPSSKPNNLSAMHLETNGAPENTTEKDAITRRILANMFMLELRILSLTILPLAIISLVVCIILQYVNNRYLKQKNSKSHAILKKIITVFACICIITIILSSITYLMTSPK